MEQETIDMGCDYLVKYKFSTAKPGRGRSQIVGHFFHGETIITITNPPKDLNTLHDSIRPILVSEALKNQKVKKSGAIVTMDILSITPKASTQNNQ